MHTSRFSLLMASFLAWIAVSASVSSFAQLKLLPEGATGYVLESSTQRVEIRKAFNTYRITTSCRTASGWIPFFDAGRPLLSGSVFDIAPTSARIVENSASQKAIVLKGRHASPAYDFEIKISALNTLPLVHFEISCSLTKDLTLPVGDGQPVIALWSTMPEPELKVDQGPDSIYGAAGIPNGYGFPAAGLWSRGVEAACFFNMTPMRWMQRDGVARFHDVRIMTRSASHLLGSGMHFKRLSGLRIPAGQMVSDFWLYQAPEPSRPSRLQLLTHMMQQFAPLHIAAVPVPADRLTGKPSRWETFARGALKDLLLPNLSAEVKAEWTDLPAELVPSQNSMIVHPGTAQATSESVAAGWDFSTVNNHLVPSLLLAQLQEDTEQLRVGLKKRDALPRFYDPASQIIRHATRMPEHVGTLEMTWQNLFFHHTVSEAADATRLLPFNPAVGGRLLMAADGLIAYSHAVNYLFPQWFNPVKRTAEVQNDMPRLGTIREPWQAGSYAKVMMDAYDISHDRIYLQEAKAALNALFESTHFTISNSVYTRSYDDPADFPITELFGCAYGIPAAYRVHEATGEAKYLSYSRQFLVSLLRLTPWYEDETDPIARELHMAGLFFPHCGAHVVTPWETSEAHLAIAWVLKHDPSNPLTPLLLKLANLNRTAAFNFFPACWSDTVRKLDPHPRSAPGLYFPIEPFYSLEGAGGHTGPTAAYMAGLALWNSWLFDATAEVENQNLMLLNVDAMDGFSEALAGIRREYVLYNPSPGAVQTVLRVKHLPAGTYRLSITGRTCTAKELSTGIKITIEGTAHHRIVIENTKRARMAAELKLNTQAQDALCRSYQHIQRSYDSASQQARAFHAAFRHYQQKQYAQCIAAAGMAAGK